MSTPPPPSLAAWVTGLVPREELLPDVVRGFLCPPPADILKRRGKYHVELFGGVIIHSRRFQLLANLLVLLLECEKIRRMVQQLFYVVCVSTSPGTISLEICLATRTFHFLRIARSASLLSIRPDAEE